VNCSNITSDSCLDIPRSSFRSLTLRSSRYSLGVIFFEMCYRPIVGMERASVVEGLRLKQPILPADFGATDKALQADIILSLLNHSPKDRPSSSELLQGGKLPVAMVCCFFESSFPNFKRFGSYLYSATYILLLILSQQRWCHDPAIHKTRLTQSFTYFEQMLSLLFSRRARLFVKPWPVLPIRGRLTITR
jgi:hypothetical protein